MNFHDYIPALPFETFTYHYVLDFDMTSVQQATANCHYSELVGSPLTLELNLTFPLGHVTEFIVLGKRTSWIAVDKILLSDKVSEMDNVSLKHELNCKPLFKLWHHGSILSEYIPTIESDSFANINTQCILCREEHWKKVAISRRKSYFADFIGRET